MSSIDTPENVRAAHLSHEASLKSIGLLYYLGAVVWPISAIAILFTPDEVKSPVNLIMTVVLLLLGWLYFQIGRWLRTLNPKARTPATLFACLGLLAVPIGTLINGYILYLLHSEKGKMVFSEYYRSVIETTPTMKYKTSVVVWIFVGLLLVFLALAMLGTFLSK